MLELRNGEEVLMSPEDDEPEFSDEFCEGEGWTLPLMVLHFTTGHRWEPEKTEKGETIRTMPDPNVEVRADGRDHIVLLTVPMPRTMVFGAFRAPGDGDLSHFLNRLVESLDESFDGISDVTIEGAAGLYGDEAERIQRRFVEE